MRILLALFLVAPAWAALSSTVVAEVRPSGANTNGGAFNTAASGTDMSQFDNKNASGCSSCQSASANLSTTDAVTNNTTTVTSATAAFTSAIVGNVIYLSGTGTTTGWYEVTGFTNSTTITVDRATGSTGGTGVTMNIGGAFKIGGTLDDDFFESFEAGNIIYVKAGTYSVGENITISKAGSTSNPIRVIGYNSTRGDTPKRSGATDNKPLLSFAAFTMTGGANWDFYNVAASGTAATMWLMGSGNKILNCKFYNLSTTVDRVALSTGIDAFVGESEIVSLRGRALSLGNASGFINGNYIHSSNEGIYLAFNNTYTILNNIIEDIVLNGIYINSANAVNLQIIGNTIAGAPTVRASSTGIKFTTGTTDVRVINNIITGWATGITHADTQSVGLDLNNAYYNNTANTSNWTINSTSTTATNPSFTAHTLISGTGGTSSTNVLTAGSGTPFTSVVDGVDFVLVTSGSGTGFTTGVYPISAHDSTTLTLAWGSTNFNLTSSGSGSSIAWEIVQGHDFSIGTGLKALGFPVGWIGLTTNYLDIGAAQRQEAGGGGTRIY